MKLYAQQVGVRRGARTILHAIDTRFALGEVCAVLGPNGAGKSTLLACLAGLLRPDAGSVELDGSNVHSMPGAQRARQLAFLSQRPEVAWDVDVESLVELGRTPHRRTVDAEANRAAVSHAMELTGISTWATRVVNELSGGERARVFLARLFAGESRWILADEPFAGLDPSHQLEAAGLLRAFAARGGGVILTIHDLTLAARIADRVVLLHEGRIAADGPPEIALSTENLRDVYGVETEWLVATARHRTPVIAIYERHAR